MSYLLYFCLCITFVSSYSSIINDLIHTKYSSLIALVIVLGFNIYYYKQIGSVLKRLNEIMKDEFKKK